MKIKNLLVLGCLMLIISFLSAQTSYGVSFKVGTGIDGTPYYEDLPLWELLENGLKKEFLLDLEGDFSERNGFRVLVGFSEFSNKFIRTLNTSGEEANVSFSHLNLVSAFTYERKYNIKSNGSGFAIFAGLGNYWYINSDFALDASTGTSFTDDNTLITERWTSSPFVNFGGRYKTPLKDRFQLEFSAEYMNQIKTLYRGDSNFTSGLGVSLGLRINIETNQEITE